VFTPSRVDYVALKRPWIPLLRLGEAGREAGCASEKITMNSDPENIVREVIVVLEDSSPGP